MDADTSAVKKKHEWNPMAGEEEWMRKIPRYGRRREMRWTPTTGHTGGSPGYQSQPNSLETHPVRKWGDNGRQRALSPWIDRWWMFYVHFMNCIALVCGIAHLVNLFTDTSGHVRFWHYQTNDCIYDIDENRRSTQTLSLSINTNADTVATVGADTQIFVYDLATTKRLNTLEAR